jgi:hypothetical protein
LLRKNLKADLKQLEEEEKAEEMIWKTRAIPSRAMS